MLLLMNCMLLRSDKYNPAAASFLSFHVPTTQYLCLCGDDNLLSRSTVHVCDALRVPCCCSYTCSTTSC